MMSWPQWILIGLTCLNLVLYMTVLKDGYLRKPWHFLVDSFLLYGLLIWGGFFS